MMTVHPKNYLLKDWGETVQELAPEKSILHIDLNV